MNAALSTAAVRPPMYGETELALSNLEQLPPKMAEEVRVFREMPAGAFALRKEMIKFKCDGV